MYKPQELPISNYIHIIISTMRCFRQVQEDVVQKCLGWKALGTTPGSDSAQRAFYCVENASVDRGYRNVFAFTKINSRGNNVRSSDWISIWKCCAVLFFESSCECQCTTVNEINRNCSIHNDIWHVLKTLRDVENNTKREIFPLLK